MWNFQLKIEFHISVELQFIYFSLRIQLGTILSHISKSTLEWIFNLEKGWGSMQIQKQFFFAKKSILFNQKKFFN